MSPQDYAITTDQLGRFFGKRKVVEGLSLHVPKGSIYGFLGLNGAGKSTTLRMMMGMLTPHFGSIQIAGLDPLRQRLQVCERVGYVPDKLAVYEWMTTQEVLSFAAYYRKKHWNWKRVKELVEVFSLPLNERIQTLSKGQQAKVNLLLAMAFEPEVLLLDEPTNGLDPVVRREFVETLLSQYVEDGRTVVISSHLVQEIAGVVDHVGILRDGALAYEMGTEEFLGEVVKLRATFSDVMPTPLSSELVLNQTQKGRELVVTFLRKNEEAIQKELAAIKAQQVEELPLNLEEAFMEVAAGGKR
ncbi:MAG: ABC transporter ATP-binding protein [Candidatus Sumerlaeia bacterium]|nr:ABC transporter ATP-binding protein [Candidatus Sumerlaeia bacterium]